MSKLLVDPGIVTAPSIEASYDDVDAYVETLMDSGRMIDQSWITIYTSQELQDTLCEQGLYPIRPQLRSLLAAKGITHIDANTVGTAIDKLMFKALNFEDTFLVIDVRTSDLATEPDILGTYTPLCLLEDWKRCVVWAAVLKNEARESVPEHILSRKLCLSSAEVCVRAKIEEIEHLREDLDRFSVLPSTFEGAISICQNVGDFFATVDEIEVWRAAEDTTVLRAAIQIALFKSRRTRGLKPVWGELPRFSIGREFLDRVNRCCAGNPPNLVNKILRAMVATLDNLAPADAYAIRTDEGGGAPQLVRDGDKAFRRRIDTEHRLHYWERQDGSIEFASVNPHNVIDIPR